MAPGTITLKVELEILDGVKVTPKLRIEMARAVHRAIGYVVGQDIPGTDCLNLQSVGEISVKTSLGVKT